MASIRERTKDDGTKAFHVQVRMQGYPARTATFRSKREAERWAKTIEASMIEGKHFQNVEARRRMLAEIKNPKPVAFVRQQNIGTNQPLLVALNE